MTALLSQLTVVVSQPTVVGLVIIHKKSPVHQKNARAMERVWSGVLEGGYTAHRAYDRATMSIGQGHVMYLLSMNTT